VILKQFYLPCLAHASYLIGDEETGAAENLEKLPKDRPLLSIMRAATARPSPRACCSAGDLIPSVKLPAASSMGSRETTRANCAGIVIEFRTTNFDDEPSPARRIRL
jgi:hypothetical protein